MAVLVPKISMQIMFYWSDVEKAVAEHLGCRADDLDYVFREWMKENDPEAGGDCSVGCHHNFDEQIAHLEATINSDLNVTGLYDDMDEDEKEEAMADEYPTLSFLKAIKAVLGEHSTRACFLYSW